MTLRLALCLALLLSACAPLRPHQSKWGTVGEVAYRAAECLVTVCVSEAIRYDNWQAEKREAALREILARINAMRPGGESPFIPGGAFFAPAPIFGPAPFIPPAPFLPPQTYSSPPFYQPGSPFGPSWLPFYPPTRLCNSSLYSNNISTYCH